jgi:hypothetical protein
MHLTGLRMTKLNLLWMTRHVPLRENATRLFQKDLNLNGLATVPSPQCVDVGMTALAQAVRNIMVLISMTQQMHLHPVPTQVDVRHVSIVQSRPLHLHFHPTRLYQRMKWTNLSMNGFDRLQLYLLQCRSHPKTRHPPRHRGTLCNYPTYPTPTQSVGLIAIVRPGYALAIGNN